MLRVNNTQRELNLSIVKDAVAPAPFSKNHEKANTQTKTQVVKWVAVATFSLLAGLYIYRLNTSLYTASLIKEAPKIENASSPGGKIFKVILAYPIELYEFISQNPVSALSNAVITSICWCIFQYVKKEPY